MGRARSIHVTCREPRRSPAPEGEGFWREAVARWERSGLSRAVFCEAEGLRPSMLLRWARKLSSADMPEPAEGVTQRETDPVSSSPLFLPVRVVRSVAQPSVSSADRIPPAHLEVLLAGDRRIRVTGDFDAELLARLVVTLEGLPCC